MRGELTPEQKQEIVAKASAMKALFEQPGWAVFKEIFERSLLAESELSSVEVGDRPLARIGEDVKLQRRLVRRLRVVFDNVVKLVESGDNLERAMKASRNPLSVTRKFDTDFGEGEDLLAE